MQLAIDSHYLLSNFQTLRILQINILFIHGLSSESCANLQSKISKDYGPILKVTFQTLHHNFYSAFVTFYSEYDASKALLSLNHSYAHQKKVLKIYYGSTKFCPNFLNNQECQLMDCNYAHYYIPWLTFFKEDLKSIDHSQIARYINQQENPKHKQEGKILQMTSNPAKITKMTKLDQISKYETSQQRNKKPVQNCYTQKTIKNREISGQQIDWLEINSEIDDYLEINQEQDVRTEKKTKIQQFLDEAETTLLSLIFKFNYL